MKNKPARHEKSSYSILHLKCPRCHQGDLFSVKNAYNFKRMLDMPDRCPHCNQDFRMEPGFYSGALWVSFPLIALFAVPLWVIVFNVAFISLEATFLMFGALIIGLQPVIMRYSRAIWIHVFVKYDPPRANGQDDRMIR